MEKKRMTFLQVVKALVRISPFWVCVVHNPYAYKAPIQQIVSPSGRRGECARVGAIA